jgi:signal transduction histidine kinase
LGFGQLPDAEMPVVCDKLVGTVRASSGCVAAVLAALVSGGLAGQGFQKQHVVILFPFEAGVAGTGPLEAAIEAASFGSKVVFNSEYLDLLRFPEPSHEESVARYLRSKYAAERIDAILTIRFDGLRFAVKHGAEIFGETPFVFVGVEQSRLEGLRLPRGFTGVMHFDDVRGTLEAALTLQPETREVVVVAGTTEYDQYWLHHDQPIFDQLAAKVQFRYLTNLPMLEILRELNHLQPHTVVFVHAFSRDSAGQEFSSAEMVDLIGRNSSAPLYGLAARSGFVGGPPAGDDDRRFPLALGLVRRILAGENSSAIPVQKAKASYPYVFDAAQLRKWKIDFSRVPRGSLLLNEEPSFWQLHRTLILGGASFVALESALLAILLIQRARRVKAEALLADRNARLEESEHSLRHLSGQLIDAQEEERTRIARELHDDLNQQVADLGISVSNVKRSVPSSLESVRTELSSVQNRLLTLSDGLRHVSHELHPGMLELFGLTAALKSHCKEFSAVASMEVGFDADCQEPVPPDVALCIYRIAQEALRNAAKHSRATQARVSLTRHGRSLQLTVSDNGVGFDAHAALQKGGLGLRSMEERAWLVHGALELISQPGSGSSVVLKIELAEGGESEPRSMAQRAAQR